MTAVNIDIEEFIKALINIRNDGSRYLNLDMVPDENHIGMNKLVLHPIRIDNDPVQTSKNNNSNSNRESKITIRNPDINPDNNDIFNALNDLV